MATQVQTRSSGTHVVSAEQTKAAALMAIKKHLTEGEVFKTFCDSFAGKSTEAQKKAAVHIVATLVDTIQNHKPKDGGKALWLCTPQSIASACMSSIITGCPVDSRQMAYLVPYGDEVQFQIGWRGFVKRIRESYANAVVKSGIVYDDEHFSWSNKSSGAAFDHHNIVGEKAGLRSWNKVTHAYFFVEYMVGNRWFSFLEVMDKAQLIAVKNKASTKSKAWDEFYDEMCKKAVIKRAAKTHFAGIMDDLVQHDNEQNYDIDGSAQEVKETADDRAKAMFEREEELLGERATVPASTTEIIDITPEPETPPAKDEPEGFVGDVFVKGKKFATWMMDQSLPEAELLKVEASVGFFRKALEKQKTKDSCLSIIEENPLLVRWLVSKGQDGMAQIKQFHAIATDKEIIDEPTFE